MSESKFKVEFTLKQHTPIIHFQSDPSGATLRATELKPKLDRFLKEHAFKGNIPKKYKISDDKDALNYKVQIVSTDVRSQSITKKIKKFNRKTQEEKIIDEGFPVFFATMGKEWKQAPKYFCYTNNLIIKIITFDEELTRQIKEYFPRFIFENNFGTRQSKGFGSFSVIKINEETYSTDNLYYNFTIDLKELDTQLMQHVQYVEKPDLYYQNQKKLFTVIEIFYKTLRSGINLTHGKKFYFKSLIYSFANSQNIMWDKKYLKSIFLNDSHSEIIKQKTEHNNPEILNFANVQNQYLIRDLLGLSTVQEWMKYKCRVRHPKEDGKDKLHGKKINSNKIKRFKSPLTIKPIQIDESQFQIYLILNEINPLIFDESITVLQAHDNGVGRNKNEVIDKKIENLRFWKQFNLDDYFSYILNHVDLKAHVEEKFHGHTYFKLINDIYSQIKATS